MLLSWMGRVDTNAPLQEGARLQQILKHYSSLTTTCKARATRPFIALSCVFLVLIEASAHVNSGVLTACVALVLCVAGRSVSAFIIIRVDGQARPGHCKSVGYPMGYTDAANSWGYRFHAVAAARTPRSRGSLHEPTVTRQTRPLSPRLHDSPLFFRPLPSSSYVSLLHTQSAIPSSQHSCRLLTSDAFTSLFLPLPLR